MYYSVVDMTLTYQRCQCLPHEIEELQEQLRRKKEELEIQAELDESLAKEDRAGKKWILTG